MSIREFLMVGIDFALKQKNSLLGDRKLDETKLTTFFFWWSSTLISFQLTIFLNKSKFRYEQ